ncbi:MAG: response regulator [Acidobacteriota bacterium]|nr:response regulator [Acidobacteriota bacterium]
MKKRVLIVEDDRFVAAFLQACLEAGGYDTDIAETGPDGLALLRESRWDLVLLDYVLPEMDGLAVLEIIRKHYPLLPVLFMTGHNSLHNAMSALKAGAADYLTKPLEPDTVMLRVSNILSEVEGDGGWTGRYNKSEGRRGLTES